MKRLFFVVLTFLTASLSLHSQMVGVLEDDARIVRGTMPNGLSYYLVRNSSVKGYADFAFVQMSGVAMEDSSSRGMTFLMECMALTETANFPDGAIFTFIDDMGLSRSDGLVIDAGDYYTTYTFSDVPIVKNSSMVDSMLLAIYNMSSALVVDARSVERGKNFFRNVFSAMQTLDQRIKDSLARYYYAGSPLSPLRQEELFERVDRYSTADVAAFYHTRCRPDMQALIVVGDIDVAAVESKIRALFQVVPRPSKPLPAFPDSVLDAAGGGYFYFQDKEAACATVTVDYIADPMDVSLRNTAVPFIYNYVSGVAMDIMKRRLERALEDAPFYAIGVDAAIVPFLNKMSYRLSVQCAPEDYTRGYELILREIDRLKRYGVSEEEFRQGSERFIASLDNTYNRRSSLDNRYYRNLCVSNFTDGYVMAGIELYRSYIEAAAPSVNSSVVGNFLKAVLSDEENRTVVCSSPEYSGGLEYFAVETEPLPEEVLVCPVADLRTGTESKAVRDDGRFVNQSTGVVSRRLPNGAVVACRRMDVEPGRVYFEAVAKGGVSLSDDSLSVLSRYIDDVARISVNGGMDMFRMRWLQEQEGIEVERKVTIGDRRITGSFPMEKAGEFMSVVASYFKGSSPDYETFAKFRAMELACAPHRYNSPEQVFEALRARDIRAASDDAWRQEPSIAELDYDVALSFVNRLYSNVADFSFIFVGDFEEEELLDYVYPALSDLPGRRTGRARGENRDFHIASYDDVEEIAVPMVFPRRLHSCKITIPSSLNVYDRMLSTVTAKVMEREVIRRLSLHGILADAYTRYYRFPEEVLTIEFVFSTYGNLGDLEQLFADIIVDLAGRGVTDNEVDAVKRNLALKDALRESRDYGFWRSVLTSRYIENKDFYTRRKVALREVTAQDVCAALETVLDEGRISLLSVVPDEESEDGNNGDNR